MCRSFDTEHMFDSSVIMKLNAPGRDYVHRFPTSLMAQVVKRPKRGLGQGAPQARSCVDKPPNELVPAVFVIASPSP